MDRYKYLIKNIGLLTVGSFATKLLTFFLVPLYTNVLTTSEYGIYDLFITTIGVLVPIFTLNIKESVLRYLLDIESDIETIISIAIKYVIAGVGIIGVALIANSYFDIFNIINDYAFYFLLLFFTQALSGVMISFARGCDKVINLSISSVIASVVMIFSNIIFLVVLKWGLAGYFSANILGTLTQIIYLGMKTEVHQKFKFKKMHSVLSVSMVHYSMPLITNAVAWWVNNLSDRFVVTWFCGLSVNGIYSVASKIPAILDVIQSIFSQAWTLSAVRDFDPDDNNHFFATTYSMYSCIMTIGCSGLVAFNRILAKLLYAKEFYEAWKYVPALTLAVVFGALSGYIGGIFSAVKDSRIFAKSTVLGAIINICLNLVFTPIFGAIGAAVATLISYYIIWLIRLANAKKYISMRINICRDYFAYAIIIVQSLLFFFNNIEIIVLYISQIILFSLVFILYGNEMKKIARKMFSKNR